jgi:Protein of unknown function (DUF4232)
VAGAGRRSASAWGPGPSLTGMQRRLLLALAGLALGAAACSSSSSTTPTTATPTTAKPASTTSTTKGTSWCTVAQLQIGVGEGSGAAGHVDVPLTFKNTSSAPCTTGGFPGAAGLSGSTQVLQAARAGSSHGTITLQPGASATSVISAVNVPSGTAQSCSNLTGLLITPPNTVATAQVTISLPGCPGLSVQALQPAA